MDRSAPVPANERTFIPAVDREAIFRELVRQELRVGRLNRATRARIVRYACGMGLSALQAGKLIENCSEEAAGAMRAVKATPRPRLVTPDTHKPRSPVLLALGIIMGIAAIAAMLRQL